MNHSERRGARLAQSLRILAEIEAASETPARVEAAVMARWDTERDPRHRTRTRTRRIVRVATTVAAGITFVSVLAWQRGTSSTARLKPDTTHTVQLKPDTTNTDATYTTVAVVGGPLMADEPIRVVRMRVARSVLGELGIPSSQRGTAQVETVDIEVLVGEDGVARGVRVPISEL
jgi:hypothetical protein